MKVENIMTRQVVSVSPETKITEVANILNENDFSGLPVVDKDNVLLGVITESDLISNDSFGIHIPSFAKIISEFNALNLSRGADKENLKSIVNATAESIMQKDCVSVKPDAPLTDLLMLFNEKNINPVIVTDDSSKLVGIVARSDIIRLVGKFSDAEFDFLRRAD